MVASIPRIFLFPIPRAMDPAVADFFIPYFSPLHDNVACKHHAQDGAHGVYATITSCEHRLEIVSSYTIYK
jgi:hypothetical protein